MTPRDLTSIHNRLAVQETIIELFVATDSKAWDRVAFVFAPKVYFDMSSLTGDEPTEVTAGTIVQAWSEGLAAVESIHHQVGNFVIDVKGTQAQASCYGIAMHINSPGKSPLTTFVGSYDFKLRFIEGRWIIELFRFHKKYSG